MSTVPAPGNISVVSTDRVMTGATSVRITVLEVRGSGTKCTAAVLRSLQEASNSSVLPAVASASTWM